MELFDLTLSEASEGLRQKKFSSLDLTQAILARIEALEPSLNAFVTVDEESAVGAAKEADKRFESSQNLTPLTGIPFAAKDIYCTKGLETTASSNILRGFVPPYDSTVIKRIKGAGGVLIGKTNCDAFAQGSSGENSDFGVVKNPWDFAKVPGGSSSGSAAAVSSSEAIFSLGTDTGGSTRLPASFCNLVGLKPTYGRVSRYGIIAMASSLDCPGTLTRTVEDAALVMQTIAGSDEFDSTASHEPVPDYSQQIRSDIRGLKIGVPREYFTEGVDPKVEATFRQAIKDLEAEGAEILDVSLPRTKYGIATYYLICHSEVSSNLARYDGIRFGFSTVEDQLIETARELYTSTRSQGFGDEAKRRIMLGTFALSAGYYEAFYDKALRIRTLLIEDFNKAFESVDVLIAPTSPSLPFNIGEKVSDPIKMYLSDILTVPASLSGLPAISVPCGFAEDLPVGMQIIGPKFSEPLLFSVGRYYEQSHEWYKMRPPIQL